MGWVGFGVGRVLRLLLADLLGLGGLGYAGLRLKVFGLNRYLGFFG